MKNNIITKKIREHLLDNAGMILFSWDRATNKITFSQDCNKVFAKNSWDIVCFKTALEFYKSLHKEDRARLRSFLESDVVLPTQEIDVRFNLGEQEVLWVRLNFLNFRQEDNGQVVWGSFQDVTKDKREYLKTAFTAYTDDLTGLLNRARMKQKIALALGASNEYNVKSIFLTISIDNLTAINNMFGHHIADDVIQAIGRRLAHTKRKSDLIARLSAGKFGLLLTDVKSTDVEKIGNRFLSVIRKKNVMTRSGAIFVTASGGGCVIPNDAVSIDSVFALSDECLSTAKKRGRNNFVGYVPSENKYVERAENILLSEKIIHSIQENRICTAFQPIVNFSHPEKSFFEVLARIKDTDGSIIPAYKFISIAENTGFIRMIDMYVFKTALEILDKNPDIQLSVNLSGHSLGNTAVAQEIMEYSQQYSHISSRLIIEITETVPLQDIYGMQEFMKTIHSLGYRIALDDFGAGYNSFSNLKYYPFDLVKIDGSYIKNIHNDKRNQILVKALSEMSEALGLEIVAEMISEDMEFEVLKNYPINYYQGYKFGKPEIDLLKAKQDMNNALSVCQENMREAKKA